MLEFDVEKIKGLHKQVYMCNSPVSMLLPRERVSNLMRSPSSFGIEPVPGEKEWEDMVSASALRNTKIS